ncbi:MAG: hypothetical protein K6F76_06805 [Clostridiales bacterium]|nr:hypothetical protein [Clostridiales bacterium]
MKKTVLIVGCLLTLLFLCSCETEEQKDMQVTHNRSIIFINEVNDADVWILPQTGENLKTTVWGTPTISKAKTGESRHAPLYDAEDDGLYILRMIDTDGCFYAADGIKLEPGWTIEIKGNVLELITVEVKDEKGVLTGTYDVFAAKL